MIYPITRREFKDIGSGDKAIGTTIVHMRRLAVRDSKHPAVQALARRLTQGKSDREAVRAAFLYVVDRIRYKNDPKNYELVRAPIHTLLGSERAGDCDCMVTALASLLLAMGYEPLFRVIAHREDAPLDFTHVNLQVKMPGGETIPLDPVMGRSGFGRQKDQVNRQRIWKVADMKLVTLEDNVANMPGAAAPGPARAAGGCKCQGRCGGKKKSKGCCPSTAKHNHRSDFAPVVVNVNTGTQSHSSDSSRVNYSNSQPHMSRTNALVLPAVQQMLQREYFTREVPRDLYIPKAAIQQAGYQDPISNRATAAHPNYKEFY